MIKYRYMTQKEKEKIAMAGILTDVDCAIEGLKVDAKSIAEAFGKVIGSEFDFWVGVAEYCSASFDNYMIFGMEDMLVVLTRLSYWVDEYGSLLALRSAINDWWSYVINTDDEEHTINLATWFHRHKPKGGER